MKYLTFRHWPLLKRIRNRYIRCLVGLIVLPLMVCLVWFIVNRAVSRLTAVRIETIVTARADVVPFTGRIRVVAYNIAHGRGTSYTNWQVDAREAQLDRLRDIADLLAEQKADIVVLNEVDFDAVWSGSMNQARYIAERAGFRFLVEQRNYDMAVPFAGLRWGNAILSKYPVTNARMVNFPPYALWERIVAGHKKGILCEVRLDEDSITRVLGVHLDTRSASTRMKSAEQIEKIRAESATPLIVAGDFNSSPIGFPGVKTTSDGATAISYLLATGFYRTDPLSEPEPADCTFPSTDPARVIDWILVSPEWKIISRTVFPKTLSDHNAVLMEIQFERPMK
jgi:endonuclease/exonuclease/phosphatase family metal-dependent hydrolase